MNLITQFNMLNGLNALVTQHRLQWLGHVRRTNDRLLKQLLLGELLPTIGLSMDQSYNGVPGGVKGYLGFGF